MPTSSNPNRFRFGLCAGRTDHLPDDVPSDIPNRQCIAVLADNVSFDGNEFVRLIECPGAIFVLRMATNSSEADCVENRSLQLMRDSIDKRIFSTQPADECMSVFWPFIKGFMHENPCSKQECSETAGPIMLGNKRYVKVQYKTIDSAPQFVEHNWDLEERFLLEENPAPSAKVFKAEQISDVGQN